MFPYHGKCTVMSICISLLGYYLNIPCHCEMHCHEYMYILDIILTFHVIVLRLVVPISIIRLRLEVSLVPMQASPSQQG